MKHLKSTLQDLRMIFEQSITVKHIAEPLASFDEFYTSNKALQFMVEKDYDIVGVRREGMIYGYVKKENLTDGSKLIDHAIPFIKNPDNLLIDATSLLKVFTVVEQFSRAFILTLGHINGIVTRGDLQKTPVRMWLFGLISLVEMQFLRIVQEYYSHESWKNHVNPKRLEEAERILSERREANSAIGLLDCLQFSDKRDIILKNEVLRNKIGFTSKTDGDKKLKQIEKLRNDLAHSQDIITGRWPGILKIAQMTEDILQNCESIMGIDQDNLT